MPDNDLHQRTELLTYAFDHHPDGMAIVDGDGYFIEVNASLVHMLGYTEEKLRQKTWEHLVSRPACSGGGSVKSEAAVLHQKGHLVHVRMTCLPYEGKGKERYKLLTLEEVTSPGQPEREGTSTQEMFTFLSEKSQNIISAYSPDRVFTYISPTVTDLLGYAPEEVVGQPAAAFNHPDDNIKLREHHQTVVLDQNTVRFTGRVRHKNGSYRWYETTVEYIRSVSGDILQVIGVGRDITERKEAEETIAHLAYHDMLTELPNRRLFKGRVSLLLKESKGLHGLLVVDLNGFKDINDTFGHEMGDRLLVEVARRLAAAAGSDGLVARWGGDEFTVLQPYLRNREDLMALQERIRKVLSEPLVVNGRSLAVTASVGAAFFPEDGDSLETLLGHADAAMYRVKHRGKR
ncbi:sensor domain-containing diguanylate cyclase [Paenibacillus sp. CC-CFT747]|nr:sensor domain-containing diguanylate cyclase [Paenibacillus sp. CC-CFT747]